MAKPLQKPRRDDRTGRPAISVRFESHTEVEDVKSKAAAAGISCNQYCVERIVLSKGFHDPIYALSAHLLCAADTARRKLSAPNDLVHEIAKLTAAVGELTRSGEKSDANLCSVIASIHDVIGKLLVASENREVANHAIIRTAQELTHHVAKRDIATRSSSAAKWDKPGK